MINLAHLAADRPCPFGRGFGWSPVPSPAVFTDDTVPGASSSLAAVGGVGAPRSGDGPTGGGALLVSSSYSRTTRFSRAVERGFGSSVEFALGGAAVKVRRPARGSQVGGGVKSAITGFTRRSRRALLLVVNAINQTLAPSWCWAFVTLTYHRPDVSPGQCKVHLKLLCDRVRRLAPSLSFVWKVEPQKRGTPHLHLLLYMPPGVDQNAVRELFMLQWHAIADPDSEEHLRVMRFRGFTERDTRREFFQPLESWSQVVAYAAKYCAKPVERREDWAFPGRYWGVHNGRKFPCTIIRVEVSEQAAIWISRQVRRYLSSLLTGRVDIVALGRRLRYTRDQVKLPGFIAGQESWARAFGGVVRRYRYRPGKSARNRVGFVPAAVVDRLVTHAIKLHPFTLAEAAEVAERELDHASKIERETVEGRARLRDLMPVIARAMARSRRPEFWSGEFHKRAIESLIVTDLERFWWLT